LAGDTLGLKRWWSNFWNGHTQVPEGKRPDPVKRYVRWEGGAFKMRYAFTVRAGDNKGGKRLTLGKASCGRSSLDQLNVWLRKDNASECRLLIPSFLEREGESFVYPPLFRVRAGAGPCYARVCPRSAGAEAAPAASPAAMARNLPLPSAGALFDSAVAPGSLYRVGAKIVFESFNWNDGVELVVVVWTAELNAKEWESAGVDWRRVGVKAELVNYVGLDSQGPPLSGTLNYLGELDLASGRLAKDAKELDAKVQEWLSQLEALPRGSSELASFVDPPGACLGNRFAKYHLFAAHFALEYTPPGGKKPVPSLRPFGKVLESPEFYRIGVRNVTTDGDSGLAGAQVEVQVAPRKTGTVELCFRAPRKGAPDLPWKGMLDKAYQDWITVDAAKADTAMEMVKPF
jgi:hypothetical protein